MSAEDNIKHQANEKWYQPFRKITAGSGTPEILPEDTSEPWRKEMNKTAGQRFGAYGMPVEAAGDMLYYSGDKLRPVPLGEENSVLCVVDGKPAWVANAITNALTGAGLGSAYITVNGDTGSTTANLPTDILDVVGDGIITTAVATDTVVITISQASNTTPGFITSSDFSMLASMCAFGTISCPAGTNPVADLRNDTLTFAASGDLTISGDSTTDTITVTNTQAAVSLAVSADVLLGLSGQQLSLDTQTANYVLAGPTTGAAAAPTFRGIVTADIATALTTPGPIGGTTPGSGAFTTVTTTSAIAAQYGGTGIASYAIGDLIYASGATTLSTLADVATGNALISGGVTTAPSWGKIGLTTHVSGILPTANGGAMPYTEVTGTSVSLAVNNRYGLNNAALVTATLPTTAAVGDRIHITGKGAGGWKLAQNASQAVVFSIRTTTSGVGGYLASTSASDSLELVCTTANTTWTVQNSIGNITYV